jgi:hypothetical protein
MGRPKGSTNKSKPKTEKKKAEPKTKAKVAPPPVTTAGGNTMDPEKRELFLADKRKYAELKEKAGKAASALRAHGKTIKADGFTVRQIQLAIQLDSPEGEAEFKALIANDLLAAQYAGAPIGSQLQLFLEPDRTPAVDMAADEGTKDAMEHKVAKPGYDPSTPQHKSYLEAYHAEQERQIKAGIKPTEDRTEIMQASRERNAEAEKFH